MSKPTEYKDYRSLGTIIFLLIIIAIIIVIGKLKVWEKSLVSYVSIIGTFLTLFGIIVAYLQILSLKHAAKATKKAVTNSIKKINQISLISDLSKSAASVEEIQSHIRAEDYKSALLRYTDIKSTLIKAKHNIDLKNSHQSTIKKVISTSTLDIESLNTLIDNSDSDLVETTQLIGNLHTIESMLMDFENELKNKEYD